MAVAIIPALNEQETIAAVVASARLDVEDVLVVDSCSTDRTAERARDAGARVVRAEHPGKHRAVLLGLESTVDEEVVFMDGDLLDPPVGWAKLLLGALRSHSDVTLAKGYYFRPSCEPSIEGGGRVTELCARPLLKLLLPQLSHIRQPLAGEFALRRSALREGWLTPGFSVDLGLLIHCSKFGRVVQVNLGTKRHKHRPLAALHSTALEVAGTILRSSGIEVCENLLS